MRPILADPHTNSHCERILCAKDLNHRVLPQFFFVGAQHATPHVRTIIASWAGVVAAFRPALSNGPARVFSPTTLSCLAGAPPLVSKGGSSLLLSSRTSSSVILRGLCAQSPLSTAPSCLHKKKAPFARHSSLATRHCIIGARP